MKFSKILTVVLLVSVLAISLIACSTSKNNKDEKQSIDSSISTLMATEPNSADEASKLHNQLMEKEKYLAAIYAYRKLLESEEAKETDALP